MRDTEMLFTQYQCTVKDILACYIHKYRQTYGDAQNPKSVQEFLNTHYEIYRKEVSGVATYIISDSSSDFELYKWISNLSRSMIEALTSELLNNTCKNPDLQLQIH